MSKRPNREFDISATREFDISANISVGIQEIMAEEDRRILTLLGEVEIPKPQAVHGWSIKKRFRYRVTLAKKKLSQFTDRFVRAYKAFKDEDFGRYEDERD